MKTNAIAAALDSVTFASPVVVDNLTMLPLIPKNPSNLGSRAPVLDYVVLDDALGSNVTEITEISDQGSVPELRLENRGSNPVLILDGEELIGAKQNRVVNLTILVAGNSALTIPVSCVEAGRWRARSRAFTSTPRTQYASGRAKRVAQVSLSMELRGARLSDQADVWADIAAKSARLKAISPTSAMEALFIDHSASIDAFVTGCQPVDGQIGALFAVNDSIVALDLFDRPSTLHRMLPKLVRGVAVDAIDGRRSDASDHAANVVPALAQQFLAVTSAAPQHTVKALGLGDDVRLKGPHLAGAALVVDQHVVHLSAFAV